MANNPYVNKVVKEGTTIIDLTSDTALASDVVQGKWFHLATGERVQGSITYSTIYTSSSAPSSSQGSNGDVWVRTA